MLNTMAALTLWIAGVFAFFLSGAWWGETRKGSTTMLAVAVMLALSALALSGCSAARTVLHACREGLCR